VFKGVRLPPGDLRSRQQQIDADQHFFLERARELGPIFKLALNGSYTTCVVGHELGARLVSTHDRHLPGVTIDLRDLFPGGQLRGMSGDAHKRYRRVFLRAARSVRLSAHMDAIAADMRGCLDALATSAAHTGDDLRDRLRTLTSGVMLRLLFGLSRSSPGSHELESAYRRFGPQEPVYRIQREHAQAFAAIMARLRARAEEIRAGAGGPPSFLHSMVEAGELDDTALGNLAYLFESSHFDLYSLWHWILGHLGANPAIQASYRTRGDAAARRAYAEAIVRETLRLEQSEVLYRQVTADIVFEGFLIPRDTMLRICIWEGHKDGDVFAQPFRFDPDRFVGHEYGPEHYAPFGLGPRHCPGASLVLGLSTLFVETLLETYDVQVAADGTSHRGAYHWQPSRELAIRLVASRALDVGT
jgi:cytochrome P450